MFFDIEKKYIASVSFGKDSLAMLLLLLEKNYPLDEVVFYNTGMEFECIYKIRDSVKELLEKKHILFTELCPPLSFEYKMFDKPVKHRDGTIGKGYSWCGGRCRWGTTDKTNVMKKYLKEKYPNGYFEYIGIAVDETSRVGKKRPETKLLPLVEWNMTESDCLKYCYDNGYHWEEDGVDLYSILQRVSCWCCANKNLKELRAYYNFLPTYWNKLKCLQDRTNRPFRNNKESIYDIEERFKREDKK